ncbi:MAG: 2-C-methyl-D-erythritol 2,4-cyclodiphosphate synthase [Bacteroidales bacterium]|jgi:2-C-methyl-D-erythritol 2,4-cyclodiphosphate synthase|nr:2-C-methyl-D-erythritol 2,4-cyclodiphosphate synthase [Bacteroidales bacterium]NLK81753.1 2-C-methyl-D-erythritol 2,4-cyclodiphosphate synthase [Bacteroidales bacterium]
MNFRIGQGFDVHAFAPNKPFILGGVKIEHSKGITAHSDGDVLLHAICDALLGAAALRDIGYHFPDTSKEFKDVDSRILLRKTYEILTNAGYTIGNIDSTICLQRPKILSYIPLMQQNIAHDLHMQLQDISIKASTTESLGFVGREEGISAHVNVLIYSNK